MPADLARPGLRAPVNVTWEVTLKCNLRCAHCLSDAGPESAQELSPAECRRLIDDLAGLKVFQVNIGGGEPFIREDFLELLDQAHDRGLVTCVSSNGLLIDHSLARRLAGMEKLYLQVSLDGATAEVNDSVRGRGTYALVLKAMDYLVREGVRFSINTVLTRQNYPQLETLRILAHEYGAEMRVSRFRPSGRGKDSRTTLAPEVEQLEAFAEWLERYDKVRTGDSFFCLTSEKRRRQGLDMCGAAKMTCCISPVGMVYPCAFLQESVFQAGDIRLTPFKDIWDRAPIFSQLRHLNVKACRTCPRFETCRGGCPAMAYHAYRDISRGDPECLVNLKTAV
ncbi:MAG: mycofactocin radical SAM maturase [Deltaproteobacteria bacterium]|nr:mycofactocin radical SAM maturase [Deltaproteobacteria bacterium]